MIGDINAFRTPVPIYPVPIDVIDADPQDDMVFCGFNRAWLPAVLGALASLKLQATWDTDDPDVMATTLQRVDTLIYQVSLANTILFVCEEFNGWTQQFNFLDDPGGFAPDSTIAGPQDPDPQWTADLGWEGQVQDGTTGVFDFIYIDFPETATVYSVQMLIHLHDNPQAGGTAIQAVGIGAWADVTRQEAFPSAAGIYSVQYDFSPELVNRVYLVGSSTIVQNIEILSCRIKGIGVNPFL